MGEIKTRNDHEVQKVNFQRLMMAVRETKDHLEKVMMDIEGVSLPPPQGFVVSLFYGMNRSHDEIANQMRGNPNLGKYSTVSNVHDWRVSALEKMEEETGHSVDDIEFCLRLNSFFEKPHTSKVLIQNFRKLSVENK